MTSEGPNPICATCNATVSPRERDWFCPSCAEYGRNTGLIRPDQPEHPAFADQLEADPELITGMNVVRSWGHDDSGEWMGKIAEYDEVTDEYIIEADGVEPFEWTEHIIKRETMQEYLWLPEPRRAGVSPTAPDELHLWLE